MQPSPTPLSPQKKEKKQPKEVHTTHQKHFHLERQVKPINTRKKQGRGPKTSKEASQSVKKTE